MNIAILHPSLSAGGGAENVVVWLASELVERGHNVEIFTSDYDENLFGTKSTKPFRITEFPMGGFSLRPARWIRAAWHLRRRLAGFDLVNPHNFPAYIYAYLARKLNRRVGPIVWFCQEPVRFLHRAVTDPLLPLLTSETRGLAVVDGGGPRRTLLDRLKGFRRMALEPILRRLDRFVVRRLDGIATNSEYISSLVERIFGVQAQPCLLGIPTERFEATDPGPASGRYTLTVSRLHPEKNLFNIVRAVKILVDEGRFSTWKHVIAGSGPLLNELRTFVREQGLDQHVEVVGRVDERRLANLFAHAAAVIYVPPSETYGLVFVEAGLYGKPVVGPNRGGPTEIVEHGVTGLQVDPLDPRSIADGIGMLVADPEMMSRLGRANYELSQDELSFPRFVDRLEAFFMRFVPPGRESV